jgi:urease accessory protein
MIVLSRRTEARDPVYGVLRLTYELRSKSRLRTALVSGEEAGLFLERGGVLRDGDHLLSEDDRVVRVEAQPEAVLQVSHAGGRDLARIAYHLGNRHVPLQVGDGWLRLMDDHVLKEMVEILGAATERLQAPFEPESGAYGAHSHVAAPPTHGGIIHDLGARKQ